MKEMILRLLSDGDDYVSGQEICERLGVSRTAVWKTINKLKEDGYGIEAVPNRGYRITYRPDRISPAEITARMETKRLGRDVRCFESVDSTNRVAKQLGEEGAAEGTLVVADEQTAGKGRSGRRWVTPKGSTIAMSLLLRPKIAPERISMVTLVMGMAVALAVRECTGAEALIKWPNDVVLSGKKICGILTEMSAEMNTEMAIVHYIVIGTGININLKEFPEEIRETATSLQIELGREVERAAIIAAVMKHFERLYEQYISTADLSLLLDGYNALLVNRGRRVQVLDPAGSYTGQALAIDELGRLLVETEDGSVRKVFAGEVSVRGIYGYV